MEAFTFSESYLFGLVEGVCSCTFSEGNMYDNQIVCLHLRLMWIMQTGFRKILFMFCKDGDDDDVLAGPVVS